MKNSFKLLFALSILVLVSACKKDADSSSVEGDWTAKSFTMEVVSSTTIQGQTITSNINGTGSNFNYDVSFDGSNFTTKGSYSLEAEVETAGISNTSNQDYNDIEGSGSYTIDGNKMTIMGQFFSLEVDGVSYTQTSDPQTTDFLINGSGDLVFSQNETMTSTDPISGLITETTIVSNSTWERK